MEQFTLLKMVMHTTDTVEMPAGSGDPDQIALIGAHIGAVLSGSSPFAHANVS